MTGWTAAARLMENRDISILTPGYYGQGLVRNKYHPTIVIGCMSSFALVIRSALRLVLHTYGFDIRRQFGELR